jgi:Arc/MetJ-type ribon-helix-helix transcriptional regulator
VTTKREQSRVRAQEVMREVAQARSLITYTELSDRIEAYNARSPGLHTLITEIAREEFRAGRGMLSAVVVKADTREPGEGFYLFAEAELGTALADRPVFWREELHRVYDVNQPASRSTAERAISVRLDPEAERALDVLVATGVNRSDAIRQALVDSADRARRNSLAEEARALSEDADDRTAVQEIATFMDALSAEG